MGRTTLFETLRTSGLRGIFTRLHDGFIYRHHKRYNRQFDNEFDLDTEESIVLDSLDFEHPSKFDAVDYEATPIQIVRRLIRQAKLDPKSSTFIDLGCGKGRVLIAAAQAGFANLIGVEFAKDVAETAQKNLRRAIGTTDNTNWSVETIDAGSFIPPRQDIVVFMYNPFGKSVLEPVVKWMCEHSAAGFRVEVLYYNPQHKNLFDNIERFRSQKFSVSTRLVLSILSWHDAAWYFSTHKEIDDAEH